MKSSICIVGLNRQFVKRLACAFACNYDLFYIDVNDMIKYDLVDVVEAKKLCGAEYIDKVSSSIAKSIANYQNTVFTIDIATLESNDNYDKIKQSALLIYLDMSKKDTMVGLSASQKTLLNNVYDVNTIRYKNICDMVVSLDNRDIEQSIKIIADEVNNYYKG